MADAARQAVLAPEPAAKLAEFARACKAAARAVSLYPGGHPAIASSLGRLAQLTHGLTQRGPYRLEVLADTLRLDGAGVPKPDAGVTELADLLHRHLVGALTVSAGADAESWRALLLLLARPPEEVRSDGGIRHLWQAAGGPSIEIEQIDYVEVLREKQGVAAAADAILAAARAGRPLALDDSGMRLLLEIVQDPARLDALMAQITDAAGGHSGADLHAAAFMHLVKGLTEWLSKNEPQRLDVVLNHVAQAASRLSADAMLKLLDERTRDAAAPGAANLAGAVLDRMSDASVAGFVAGSVVKERGASERLAHAFQALVPDVERQRQLLALAERDVAASEIATDNFEELWGRVEGMLTSYSDESFVSEEYGRELSGARTRAVEVERTSDDPPERVAAWLHTVTDTSLRSLDHELLVDLLAIEAEPARWRDIAETVATHADDLVRVGHFDQAWALTDAVVTHGAAAPERRPHASAALARFGRGPMMQHVSAHLRGADDVSFERFKALCHAIGPAIVPALAEVLSSEQDARSRRRLRDILVGFGSRGREAVQQLMTAANWEVRRTAAYLLREFGGSDALKELIPLLTDSEPLVQREAVQGLVMSGSDEASRTLLQAITSAKGRTRETLLNELTAMRDDRAAPLFCYLLRHMDRRKEQQLYLTSIDALGAAAGPEAVEALKFALHQGDWWSPFQTRRTRAAAARALRRIGTPGALEVLRQASARGPRGVRSAARGELAGLG